MGNMKNSGEQILKLFYNFMLENKELNRKKKWISDVQIAKKCNTTNTFYLEM